MVCERDKVGDAMYVPLFFPTVHGERCARDCVFQERVPKFMIPIGRRSIDAQTRADLNEVTARPLTLHAFADCWVRTFTSLDPQA